jgi:hypothetical protein
MKAPWKFKCKNLHIQFDAKLCDGKLATDISDSLCCLPKEAKVSQRMLLTITKMSSTCYSEDDFITSNEAILKVMIELHSTQYYFPVLAVVDAPHSITRGVFLGYTKHIGKVQLGNAFGKFELEGVENSVHFKKMRSEVENIALYPHLTYRNYRTTEFQAQGLSVLDITNHTASPALKCNFVKVHVPFLDRCGIKPLSPYKAGIVSDSFTVNGANYV